ncbi:MAG: hypothetical protein ACREMT_07135, partial [Vulcanimicrobiaceae bacterium]
QTPFAALVATQLLGGVGYAFIWVPLSVMLFKSVPQIEIPAALALTRLVQQIGASAGSAYAATLLDRGYDSALSNLAGNINLHNTAVASFVAEHGSHAIAQLSALVSSQAQNIAAADATRFFGLFTALAAVLPFLLRRRAVPAASVVAAVDPLEERRKIDVQFRKRVVHEDLVLVKRSPSIHVNGRERFHLRRDVENETRSKR